MKINRRNKRLTDVGVEQGTWGVVLSGDEEAATDIEVLMGGVGAKGGGLECSWNWLLDLTTFTVWPPNIVVVAPPAPKMVGPAPEQTKGNHS